MFQTAALRPAYQTPLSIHKHLVPDDLRLMSIPGSAPRQPCCPGRWVTGSPGCEHIGFSLWLWQGWEASSDQIQAPVFLLLQHLGTMTFLQHPGGKLLGKRNQITGVLGEHLVSLSVFLSNSPQAVQAWDRAFQEETDRGYSRLLCLKGFG